MSLPAVRLENRSRKPLALGAASLLAAWLATACDQTPPRWDRLIASRITDQFPDYRVRPVPDGGLLVDRPHAEPVPVDVEAIAAYCRRGSRDCDYALDQMLLGLQMPAR